MGPDQGVPSPLGERLCRRGEPPRSRAFPVRGLGGGADAEDGWLPHRWGARGGRDRGARLRPRRRLVTGVHARGGRVLHLCPRRRSEGRRGGHQAGGRSGDRDRSIPAHPSSLVGRCRTIRRRLVPGRHALVLPPRRLHPRNPYRRGRVGGVLRCGTIRQVHPWCDDRGGRVTRPAGSRTGPDVLP